MSNEILEEIREQALRTTVTRLATSGVESVRVVRMETLEKIFEKALERALQRSLARLPSAARRTFEKEAREELREVVKEAGAEAHEACSAALPDERQATPEVRDRKGALLELVFRENLALRGLAA
jgi:hypothetical protein